MTDVKVQFEETIRALDGNRTFFDTANFPWVKQVEALWPAIRQEADRLLACVDLLPGFEEIQAEQEALSQDKRWKIFLLHVYGQEIAPNQRRCPATTTALKAIPGLRAAMFSVLQKGKELPPHQGPFAGVLRYHLGVKVPPNQQCGIKVGDDIAYWKEGESMIFDDSHMHSAWNRSDQDRVVLFVDFTRPLPSNYAAINNHLITALSASDFIHEATRRWNKWETMYGGALDRHLAAN